MHTAYMRVGESEKTINYTIQFLSVDQNVYTYSLWTIQKRRDKI